MSTKSYFATLAMAVLVMPVAADVPDGHGGRTSPQALSNNSVAAPHFCCDKIAGRARQMATNPAEMKALGHLAWVSRAGDPLPAMRCYKNVALAPTAYRSPAELKAYGHLANVSAAAPAAREAAGCCDQMRCPMRRAS
jgi:hypothetical protein